MSSETPPVVAALGATDAEVKSCCAAVYASDWARRLLGDSFHPGGLALTERVGELLRLGPADRVLDVAAGAGASAIALARRFGCRVVGVDFSAALAATATTAAAQAGLSDRVSFERGDAERLPVEAGGFDAVICECAFCTFPDKPAAAAEFARVLRPGGRVGLSDLTRAGPLRPALQGLLAWVACIAGARPIDEYLGYLAEAGFVDPAVEIHDDALAELVRGIRQKLLGIELLSRLGKLDLPGVDLATAAGMAKAAADAVAAGELGYAIVVATRAGA